MFKRIIILGAILGVIYGGFTLGAKKFQDSLQDYYQEKAKIAEKVLDD